MNMETDQKPTDIGSEGITYTQRITRHQKLSIKDQQLISGSTADSKNQIFAVPSEAPPRRGLQRKNLNPTDLFQSMVELPEDRTSSIQEVSISSFISEDIRPIREKIQTRATTKIIQEV